MSGSPSILRLCLFVAVCASIGIVAALPEDQPTRLTFLAVGQGDCAVFQTGGHTILIDTGPNIRGNDAGRRIVVPSLRKMGIDAIDLVLLSHPDMDHMGGLGAILKNMPVGRIAVSASFSRHKQLLDYLKDVGCGMEKVAWLGPDTKARVGGFEVEVDCPKWSEGDPDNDGSEFVKISDGRISAVFSGDASATAEQKMLSRENWAGQILKVGHHGSHTASSESWLKAVRPEWAVVSCGRESTYGHPHRQVLERLQRLGIKLARTDREGDITFEFGPRGWVRR